MTEIASQTLQAAAREVNIALTEARSALEAYVEQSNDSELLRRCADELHQVRGALRVLEIHGGALLAEEMEQVARYLAGHGGPQRNQPEALDALMRSIVQLPGYLERVHAGGRDMTLVLLPLLNDLRAVRGGALLSEGTLLLLNLKSDRQAEPASPPAGGPPLAVAQWARRLRARFQTGLVGWIRNEREDENLEALAGVAMRMEQVATQQCVFQLWWVVGAVIEALREQGIESSVAVKRLLGLADRELKSLYEVGEARYAQNPPIELLNNLLYYVARASTHGPRVSAVRASFRLDELLPVDEEVEQERDNLSAPSVKLMHTVAAAIREDLGRVKETLDIFVRRGGHQVEELRPQTELLRKLADTMGVLGLGELRTRVQEANAQLLAVVNGQSSADIAQLVQVAATLIKVDDHLDDQLVGLILPRRKLADDEADDLDQDFRHVQSALLRECGVNLARVKECVAQNVNGNLDAAGFDGWPELMRGVKAGLLMLGKGRAVEILDRIVVHLRRVMQPGGTALSGEFLDRLADAIVSLEYYIETLQAGRKDPWYMLDNAQRCIEVLDREPANRIPTVPVAPIERTHTMTLPITPIDTPPAMTGDDLGHARPAAAPPLLPAAPVATQIKEVAPVDADLLRLFAEEAGEELQRIQRHFPVWDLDPLQQGALETVRRSFHTLKGSGRMVGARDLAEFAWSVENLLNRLLDGTLSRSPAIMETLRDSVGRLPALVAALEAGSAQGPDVATLVGRAHALAAGHDRSPAEAVAAAGASRTPAAARPIAPAPVPVAPAPAPAPVPEPVALTAPNVVALPVAPAPPPLPAAVATPPAPSPEPTPATDSGQRVEALAADQHSTFAGARSSMPEAGLDAALREIYARETSGHVATVRAWLARERSCPAPHVLPEPVYRACHTMRGSSKMAEARHGIRLAEPIEHWLRQAFDSGVGLDDADLQLLADCMTAMESVAGHLDENTGYFSVHETLRARIARAELDLERRIHENAAKLADSGLRLGPQGTETAGADFDPEVAAIFCEEAAELLDAAQIALSAWNADAADGANVAALKRPLHTLKGGARMAGITAMGDLSHELESLVGQVELGLASRGSDARSVIQQGIDELARMREAALGGRATPPALELIARIKEAARAGGAPTTAAAAPAPAAPPTMLPAAPAPLPTAEAQPAAEYSPLPAPVPTIEPETPSALPAAPPLPVAASAMSFAEAEAPPLPVAPLPPGREPVVAAERGEMARVSAELLDQLLNGAGEVSIVRARLEQQLGAMEFNLGELSRTVTRLKEQLRKLELETEAQILHRHGSDAVHRADFDPLEMDRYSSIQQFSRALAESASDVASLQQLLETMITDAQGQLQQQGRLVAELQNGLMNTRMVPFQRHVQRLSRIVRQAAQEAGKPTELIVAGGTGELDRQVLDRMLPPLEHMLRNAVVHGIEAPATRQARGKDPIGHIHLSLRREGAEVIIELADDGGGMDLAAIRAKGTALGLIGAGQEVSQDDLIQLVLEPGFSTADTVTQQAGRGVGMDVVATEIKKLGGALHIETTPAQGTRFTVKLPFTLATSHALVVRVGDEVYALPLPTIEGVVRLPRDEVAAHLRSDSASFSHNGARYRVQPLAQFVGMEASTLPEQDAALPLVLVRAGENSSALVAEELIGSREIVVKPVGPQLAAIRGISGATILSDGRVVVILDIGALVRAGRRGRVLPLLAREATDQRTCVLVVDDSITVRRVTQRLLERNGMRVITARDGMDAMALLQENRPDIILLDIEMPRMDGYEVAAQVRADPVHRDVPIIMITSRVGDKHRARAIELGVNDYLGKPYQESQLLNAIAPLVAARRGQPG